MEDGAYHGPSYTQIGGKVEVIEDDEYHGPSYTHIGGEDDAGA